MKRLIDFSSRFRILKGGKISLVISAFLGGAIIANAAPSGGTVTSGNATINQSGNVTNINQSTQKASINWNDFSVKSHETVNFNQPNVNSITLNRVIGNEKSVIDGALNANGQVWILNSNGVLFGKNASINTAGLLASTAELSDTDFQNGNYEFKNSSSNSVINLGTIEVTNNAYVVLASNEVKNTGTIKAVKGKVHLVGADSYSLNLNGNSIVNLKVDKGVLDALVENSGHIIADGGEIFLTTNAVNELLKGVVNNTGILEANSLDGITGKVELFAHGGEAQVGGTIEAQGGFVETSGKELSVKSTAQIKTAHWLLDPDNIIISSSGEDDLSGAAINATAIENALATASVELQAGEDITVNEDITWEEATKLTLNAGKNIFINSEITALNDNGQLALYYSQYTDDGILDDDYYINAPINLKAGDNFFTKKGSNAGNVIIWKVITGLGNAGSTTGTDLQGINGNLSGNFVLGSNIDASATSSWNAGEGFDPLGSDSTMFTGNFDGLGHIISNLNINRPTQDYIGLFGMVYNSNIQNLGVVDADIKGKNSVGAIVGGNYGNIFNVYSTGTISGDEYVGGLLGENDFAIVKNSYSTSNVSGTINVGGFVGYNFTGGTIKNSFSLGNVDASTSRYGGFVGRNQGTIETSYSTGLVTGSGSDAGGFAGYSNGTITNSYWDAQTSGIETDSIDGTTAVYSSDEADAFNQATYAGFDFTNNWYIIEGDIRPLLRSMYSTTISNKYQLQLMNMNLTADYKLQNDIDLSSTKNKQSDIWNLGKGWRAIGDNTTPFTGNFNGNDYTLSNLYINRPTTGYQGLFGKINNSTISNIKLTDGEISGGTDTGSIVGMAIGDSILSNIIVSDTDISAGTGSNIGGIVGTFNGTQINNVKFSDGDISGGSRVGGIVGITKGGDITSAYSELGQISASNFVGGISGSVETDMISVEISNSASSMDLKTSNFQGGLGGLVGYLGGDAGISYSFYMGTIEGNQYAGGLVGYMDYWGDEYRIPYIKNSFSVATITVPDMSDAGGLVGITNAGSLIENSYFAGQITGNMNGSLVGTISGTGNEIKNSYYDKTLNPNASDLGDTGKTTDTLQNIAIFSDAGWEIETDSTLSDNYKYPQIITNNGVISWKIYGTSSNGSSTGGTTSIPSQNTQQEQIADIVTPIINGTRTNIQIPQIQVQNMITNSTQRVQLQTIASNMGLGPNARILSTTQNGTLPNQIVTLAELQQSNAGYSEVRVALSENSLIDLINGGVNLPIGVDQQFFVVNNNNNI